MRGRLLGVTSQQDSDRVVRLDLPAHPRYLAAARVVAASLAAEAGMSVDDLEDLRLGVGELLSTLIDGAAAAGRVALEFSIDGDEVTISAQLSGTTARAAADELTARILGAVVDHYELDTGSFRLTKSSSLRGR